MSVRHIWAVTRKEINHIFRDRSTLILVLFTPTLVLLLMAYALTVEIKHVPLAVLDYDQSQASRTFVRQITAGQDVDLYAYARDMDEITSLLMRGQVKAALVISSGFAADLQSMKGLPVQIIIDGTEPESGNFAVQHIAQSAEQFVNTALAGQLRSAGISAQSLQPLDMRIQTWFNPDLKPRNDIIPGLISMVLGFPALSVALTLAHEREHGTLEQLLATPISRTGLLLGKIIPYIGVGLLNVILIPALAIAWFHISFNGSFALFLWPVGDFPLRRAQYGHGGRGIDAHPGRCPGPFFPGHFLPRFLHDRHLFPPGFYARGDAPGVAVPARHPLCHHHPRHLPARGGDGRALALCRDDGGAGGGLHRACGAVLPQKTGVSHV